MLDRKNKLKLFLREILSYFLIIVVVLFIKTFIVAPVLVNGSSMYPTLEDKDFLLLNRMDKSYERFDIVVVEYRGEKLVKRIIGMPGETIEYKDKKLYINGKEMEDQFASVTYEFKLENLSLTKIPDDSYFILGDNRNNSIDSRRIGPVHKDDIQGKIVYGIVPFGSIKKYNSMD